MTSLSCIVCSRPAVIGCALCMEAPSIDGTNRHACLYCSTGCSQSDFERHQPMCHILQDRKIVYRVMEFAQKLFLTMREVTWGRIQIGYVESDGYNLVLRGTRLSNDIREYEYTPFRSWMFASPAEREAALSFLGCNIAKEWAIEFMGEFLIDIVTLVEPLQVRTRNNLRRTRVYPVGAAINPFDYIDHTVLRITLRSGERYVVDLAGAQYGYREPIQPWARYEYNQVEYVTGIFPPPDIRHILLCSKDFSSVAIRTYLWELQNPKTPANLVQPPWINVLLAMNYHFLQWQDGEQVPIGSMFHYPTTLYVEKLNELIQYVEWCLSFDYPYLIHTSNVTERGSWLRDNTGDRWVFKKNGY